MSTDELLDAHVLRLRNDPGYAAIWQRANSRLYPDMKLIVAMLAWAEQADGLRGGRMTPLFIPLKAEYFEAFERGEKTIEYRPFGPRWNENTCAIGRPVVLSYGYGKKRRLRGVVVSFHVNYFPETLPGWTACYGASNHPAACIGIKVEGKL